MRCDMRGHLPASRATKRQRRRPENEPRYCRARRRAAHCSAKASASFTRCLQCFRRPDDASVIAFCEHVPWPGHSTPRRPAKTAQPPAVVPASKAKQPWKYLLGSACRTARTAHLRGPGSPHPNRLVSACRGLRKSARKSERRVAAQRAPTGTSRQASPPSPAPPAPTEHCSTRPTIRHRPRPIHCRARPAPRPARRP